MIKHTVYYFTGTGNSLKAAKDIASGLKNAALIPMAAYINTVSFLRPRGTVGFVFPVYYCGLPQLVEKFISALDLSGAEYIYAAFLYGSAGGNAGCASQTRKILKKKGKRLNSSFYIKGVDNFILWTWDVPRAEKHAAIHERVGKKAALIAEVVLDKKNFNDFSVIEHIGPVIFGYRHFLKTVNTGDTAFYCGDGCKKCGLCAKVCPIGNIDIKSGRPVWRGKSCQRCLACLHWCPAACIQYGKVTAKRSRYKNPYVGIGELTERK